MSAAFPRRLPGALLSFLPIVLWACAGVQGGIPPAPPGALSGKEGWLTYSVGLMRFDAPAGWTSSGVPHHLLLERPDGQARLEVSTKEAAFPNGAACLADAEELMKRGDTMKRVRRHPTRFAGLRALALEGEERGWEVWAWAACDGGVQYQVFLTARTPAPSEVVDLFRALTSGARVGGET